MSQPALTQEQMGAMFESHQSFDTDGIKRNQDMKIRPELNRRQFLQTTALAASALPFMGVSAEPFLSLERSSVYDQLKRFAAEKWAQASAAARAQGKQMLLEFKPLFAAARKGDWPAIRNIWREMQKHAAPWKNGDPRDWRLHGIQTTAVQEIYGAFENIMGAEDRYAIAFGRDIIESIPRGSIYFGGTDPGRFVITALCKSQVNGDPFFTFTQNSLADRGYLQYVRGMYGDRIYIPTDEEHQKCFNEYMTDAHRRMKENKLKPGEDLEELDGNRMNVSGQVAVMAINGLLAKLIFDRNPEREFYLEESFPLDWMYPHLEPHGLILKINRQPLAELSDDVLKHDREYWMRYIQPMIGEWLTCDTPVGEIAAFVDKRHVKHDLGGFKGDPRFVQNGRPQRLFSKLRSSIGGLYSWRVANAENPVEKERMLKEAGHAFRQAFALCPSSPEVVFRYTSLLAARGERCLDDATLIVETALKVDPEHAQFPCLLEQLKKMKKN